MMNRIFLFLLFVGVILLTLSLFSPNLIGAHPTLQVTITPMAFNYLPFVAKNWPPTPTSTSTPTVTPTPTPTVLLPQPGFWTGSFDASFTVSSDYKIRNFSINLPRPTPQPGTCRFTADQDIPLGVVGLYASLALGPDGRPHISYYDQTNQDLRYAVWDSLAWRVETVDAAGDVGQDTSLKVDHGGRPHISYYDVTNGIVKYATLDGSTWRVSIIGTALYYGDVSLALDTADKPHILYNPAWGKLNYAQWDGTGWITQTVPITISSYLGDHSLAIDTADNPHIAVVAGDSGLVYARWDGIKWVTEQIYSDRYAGHISLSLDGANNPHASYWARSAGALGYAKRESTGWQTQLVEWGGGVGQYSSLALDSLGRPHISYYDWRNRDLKYARWTGSMWDIQVVDSDGDRGQFSSLVLDAMDNPHIAYHDAVEGDLCYAVRAGSSWARETVDSILANRFSVEAFIQERLGIGLGFGRFDTPSTLAGSFNSVLCGPELCFYSSPLPWTASWQRGSSTSALDQEGRDMEEVVEASNTCFGASNIGCPK